MAAQRIPGVAVAVVRNGEVIKAQGYGLANVEHNVPVTPETIFQSGSLGKQFTAAVVMLLVEDGKLALSDRLSKFYPDGPASWQSITIRHLLTHTSGLPDYTGGRIDLRHDYSEDELARLAYEMPLEFAPGDQWKYSNTGYVLLGAIVRKVSGTFYGDLLRDRVFRPMGMTTARVISEADIVPHRAAGYRLVKGVLQNQEWVSPQWNTTADGSLYLSLQDWIAWDRGLRAGSVLKPESWRAVFEPVRLNSGRRHPYGFGWDVERLAGQEVRRHGGAWQGFKTYIARYLGDDITIIALANLEQAQPERIVNAIAEHFIPKLRETPAWTIIGAEVADGTGALLRRVDVRIEGDSIREVGAVRPHPDDRIIDGTGFVLAPGLHRRAQPLDRRPRHRSRSHHPGVAGHHDGARRARTAARRSRCATICGKARGRRHLNVALLAGHATIRRQVMGEDFRRPATAAGDRAHGSAGRSGNARRRHRAVVGPRVRSRQLCVDRRDGIARPRGRAASRVLHLPHTR